MCVISCVIVINLIQNQSNALDSSVRREIISKKILHAELFGYL